jgi:hypothetical protein
MHDILLLDAVYKINIEVEASIRDADRPDAHAIKTEYSSVSFYLGRVGSRVKGPCLPGTFSWTVVSGVERRHVTRDVPHATAQSAAFISAINIQFFHRRVVTLIIVCVQGFQENKVLEKYFLNIWNNDRIT